MEVTPISGSEPQQQTPKFTAREKRDELAREVNLRKSVYPGQVRQGRMTHEQAERQKAIMYAIWQDYCAIVSGDASEPQKRLDLSPADHEAARDDNRQSLNAMAHAGDGDGALTEAAGGVQTIGVDHGAGDDMTTTHRVKAGGGDGAIEAQQQPKFDAASDAHSETPPADSSSSSD